MPISLANLSALPQSSELAAIAKRAAARKEAALSNEQELRRCGKDADGVVHWFNNYVWTYDPRLIGKKDAEGNRLSPYIPFVLWPRQVEFIHWLWDRFAADEQWLVEKSRDTGLSYLCCGFTLNRWLFQDGFKGTFGSRKTDYVDKADQPDSLFQKIRIMLDRVPPWMQPEGFHWNKHSAFCRLVNPANGAIITGEGGEDMGRGGRSSIYVVDEAAFVPGAENVEKALSGNTECVGWVSSVNGMGNLFARKRHSILAEHQIFKFHYSADPRKTKEWAARKKAEMSDPAAWASEYEIDYAASIEDVCIPAKWIQAAQQIHTLCPEILITGEEYTLGGDVGAGKARSVVVPRRGQVIDPPKSRGDPDTIGTANWMLDIALELQARLLNFDAPGVGAGVSSGLLNSERRPHSLTVQPINTGSDPFVDPEWDDGRTSDEQFRNLKMEIWWIAAMRFKRTYEHMLHLEGKTEDEGAKEHRITDLIHLPSGDVESDRLATELSTPKKFRTDTGKLILEKKEQLAKRGIKSPDYADALVLTFIPDRGPGYTLDNV